VPVYKIAKWGDLMRERKRAIRPRIRWTARVLAALLVLSAAGAAAASAEPVPGEAADITITDIIDAFVVHGAGSAGVPAAEPEAEPEGQAEPEQPVAPLGAEAPSRETPADGGETPAADDVTPAADPTTDPASEGPGEAAEGEEAPEEAGETEETAEIFDDVEIVEIEDAEVPAADLPGEASADPEPEPEPEPIQAAPLPP
jgi:hypothetical protein